MRPKPAQTAHPTPRPPTGLDVALRLASLPAPQGPRQPVAPAAAKGVFLSPRVLDQNAYAELSAALRSMCDAAAAERQKLDESVGRAAAATQAARDAEARQKAAAEVLGKLVHALNSRAAESARLLKEADECCARANTLSATLQPLFGTGARSIPDLLARSESERAQLASVLQNGESESRTLSNRQDEILRLVLQSQREVRELLSQVSGAQERLNSDIQSLDRAGAAVDERVQLANQACERLRSVGGSASDAASAARGAIVECEEARAAFARAGVQLADLVRRAEEATGRLADWGELLRGRPDAELPPALERVVTEFRTGLSEDLRRMAAAMSLIAHRAELPARPMPQPAAPEVVIRPAPLAPDRQAAP